MPELCANILYINYLRGILLIKPLTEAVDKWIYNERNMRLKKQANKITPFIL